MALKNRSSLKALITLLVMKKNAAGIRNIGLASKTSPATSSGLTLLKTNQSASPDAANLRSILKSFLSLLPNENLLNAVCRLVLTLKIGSYYKFCNNSYCD